MCELESMSPVDDAWRIPDSLWERILPLLPPERPHPKGGRRYIPARQCMDGIFYVMRTGCQWKALPKGFAASSTVHLRFQQWRADGVFERLWREGLIEYDVRHGLRLGVASDGWGHDQGTLGGEKEQDLIPLTEAKGVPKGAC